MQFLDVYHGVQWYDNKTRKLMAFNTTKLVHMTTKGVVNQDRSMVKIPDVVHNEVWGLKNDSQETFEKAD